MEMRWLAYVKCSMILPTPQFGHFVEITSIRTKVNDFRANVNRTLRRHNQIHLHKAKKQKKKTIREYRFCDPYCKCRTLKLKMPGQNERRTKEMKIVSLSALAFSQTNSRAFAFAFLKSRNALH